MVTGGASGLGEASVRTLINEGAKAAILDFDEERGTQLAAELGIDLIITDHHQVEGELPPALTILHPDLPGQDYPYKDLCGAGVAFKLAWALAQRFSGAQKVSDEFREFLLAATALVALGTVADHDHVEVAGRLRLERQAGQPRALLADRLDLGRRGCA